MDAQSPQVAIVPRDQSPAPFGRALLVGQPDVTALGVHFTLHYASKPNWNPFGTVAPRSDPKCQFTLEPRIHTLSSHS